MNPCWVCASCKKEEELVLIENNTYERPSGWLVIKDHIKTKHFCSKECLTNYTSNIPQEDLYPNVGGGKDIK